jgi:hypothetical protein
LLYAKFSYDNSYQESLKMAPFEMMYGRRCQTPLFWNETGEQKVFGPDILQEAERQVRMVRENLRIAQSRQKCYANHRRRELSFVVGNHGYLKVSPMRGLRCFKVRGKLALRFIGPFKIMMKRFEVANQLELPSQLSDVRNVFRASQPNKWLRVLEEQMPMEDLTVSEDLSYPVKILETSERATRNKTKMCKEAESTRESEEESRVEFSKKNSDPSKSQGQDSF